MHVRQRDHLATRPRPTARTVAGALCFLAAAGAFAPAQEAAPERAEKDPFAGGREAEELPKMLRVPVTGFILPPMVARIERDVERWLEDEPKIHYVVFEVDTPGGELDAAKELADFISRRLKDVITIVFIPPGKQALSAGALIAVAAREIVMGENTVMGAASPRAVLPRPDGTFDFVDLPEKDRSAVRGYFRTYNKDKYPDILTDAMVNEASSDIRKYTLLETRGGDEVEVTRYLTESDYRNEKRNNKTRQVGDAPLVLREGELLTMTENEALEYRFVKHIRNDLAQLREAMNIVIPDENVIDVAGGALRPSSPGAQRVIDFLNHPIVRGLLLMAGCLGVLFELKLLGTMVSGIIALVCFAIFFIGAAFPVTGSIEGTASVYEIILFMVGVGLVAVELAVPGFAVFAIAGCGICATSIVMAMIPGDTSSIDVGESIQSALSIFLWSFVLGIALFFSLIKYLPRLPGMRRRGGIVSDGAIVGVPNAESALEDQARLSSLIGKSGVVATTLRPAGKIELDDGRFVDVVSNGEYIEKGERITVKQIDGPRIVVARIQLNETPEHES